MSKEIQLTQGKVAIVDDADYEWLNQWKWCFHKSGYAQRAIWENFRCRTIWMHREINNTQYGMDTDHINRDRLDNRRDNLRSCSTSENCSNHSIYSSNTTGYIGVTYDKSGKRIKRWYARIAINGENISIGHYATPEEAARAYDEYSKNNTNGFGTLNFP